MCVFVFVCCEFFWRAVIPEEEKKKLGCGGSFVEVSYCTPVSQIKAVAEWKQAPLLFHTQLLYIFISSR